MQLALIFFAQFARCKDQLTRCVAWCAVSPLVTQFMCPPITTSHFCTALLGFFLLLLLFFLPQEFARKKSVI